MNDIVDRCPNMNHGRANAPVKFCPTCGKTVNARAHRSCDSISHAVQRKDRGVFCLHCAKKL